MAAEAGAGQFLVTEAVREQTVELTGVVWERIGRRRLKGLSEPVELFDVRTSEEVDSFPVDPVCGMQIESAASELRLSVDDGDVSFCSHACMQRFQAAPDGYRTD